MFFHLAVFQFGRHGHGGGDGGEVGGGGTGVVIICQRFNAFYGRTLHPDDEHKRRRSDWMDMSREVFSDREEGGEVGGGGWAV